MQYQNSTDPKFIFVKTGILKIYRKVLFKISSEGNLMNMGPSFKDLAKNNFKEILIEIDIITKEETV